MALWATIGLRLLSINYMEILLSYYLVNCSTDLSQDFIVQFNFLDSFNKLLEATIIFHYFSFNGTIKTFYDVYFIYSFFFLMVSELEVPFTIWLTDWQDNLHRCIDKAFENIRQFNSIPNWRKYPLKLTFDLTASLSSHVVMVKIPPSSGEWEVRGGWM